MSRINCFARAIFKPSYGALVVRIKTANPCHALRVDQALIKLKRWVTGSGTASWRQTCWSAQPMNWAYSPGSSI